MGRPLLLGRWRLLERRLGLLRQWLRGGSSAECRTCGATTANIAAARIDCSSEMIRQAKPARRNHDEKLGILKSAAF